MLLKQIILFFLTISSKVQSQGVAYTQLFANISLVMLIKVLLIKKACNLMKYFLAFVAFAVHNKGIATKLTEKMGRAYPTRQLFCNDHTVLV